MSIDFSRRELLRNGGLLAVGMMAPPWLSAIAKADVLKVAKGGKVNPDNVLIVVQLSGGNDGLNTVIPYTNQQYYAARPTLGIAQDKVLPLEQGMGLHPAMKGIADLYKQGKVAIIQGVGYPNPNRSHFRSMDIWQSASPDGMLKSGWIGRAYDLEAANHKVDPLMALGLSTEKPRALSAPKSSIPCFASLSDIQQMVGDPDAEKMLRDIQGMDADAGSATHAIQLANQSALDAMSSLKTKLAKYTPAQTYGTDAFGKGFKQIAQLVAASSTTRVVYFSAGGFDTHARQAESHEKLLGGFSAAVSAFQAEMEAVGKADKVTVVVFSEFGRRTFENGSAGTDHGQAAPMFLIGKNVKGGLYGPTPDLAALSDGDIKWHVDFRDVYATTLDNWMGSDSGVVLGGKFEHMPIFR